MQNCLHFYFESLSNNTGSTKKVKKRKKQNHGKGKQLKEKKNVLNTKKLKKRNLISDHVTNSRSSSLHFNVMMLLVMLMLKLMLPFAADAT